LDKKSEDNIGTLEKKSKELKDRIGELETSILNTEG
jgi:hypothetical protein